MSDFARILTEIVAEAPYHGSQRALARAADISHSHLTRVISGERDFSPNVVGRIAKLLPPSQADRLIRAYLREVAAEIAESANRDPVPIR